METGTIRLSGPASAIAGNREVESAYLGTRPAGRPA
jgi:hypothetical protein